MTVTGSLLCPGQLTLRQQRRPDGQQRLGGLRSIETEEPGLGPSFGTSEVDLVERVMGVMLRCEAG